MRRRNLLVVMSAGAAALPIRAIAQRRSLPALVGFFGSRTSVPAETEAFQQAMRDLGYVEGHDVLIEYRTGPTPQVEDLPRLALELVQRKPDVIASPGGTPSVKALMQATATIPIVMVNSNDAVEAGLVSSLSRPGGNVTGISWQARDLLAKRLELLHEALPDVRRVAVFTDLSLQGLPSDIAEAAGKSLGIEVLVLPIARAEDLNAAFETAVSWGAQALSADAGRVISPIRDRFVELAAWHRLPSMHHQSIIVQAGGLISYGPDFPDLFRRAAGYVVKILEGAKPGELPVEQPSRFELAINLKTAKSLGLTIPPAVVDRADKVIE